MMPCSFTSKTCVKTHVLCPPQSMTRKTHPITCVWCKSFVQQRSTDSMNDRCASRGKRRITIFTNASFMTSLLFALLSFSTCTNTLKLQCEEPLSLLGHIILNSKNISFLLTRILGFQDKEWPLNSNKNRTSLTGSSWRCRSQEPAGKTRIWKVVQQPTCSSWTISQCYWTSASWSHF